MLLYLNKVEVCNARHLHTVVIDNEKKCAIVQDWVPWEIIPAVQLSSLTITDEMRNGQRVYTSKLTIRLQQPDIQLPSQAAFRLTDVDGRQYLLGLSERPYPACNVEETRPADPSEPSLSVLKVEQLSIHPMLRICDLS